MFSGTDRRKGRFPIKENAFSGIRHRFRVVKVDRRQFGLSQRKRGKPGQQSSHFQDDPLHKTAGAERRNGAAFLRTQRKMERLPEILCAVPGNLREKDWGRQYRLFDEQQKERLRKRVFWINF
ncbi:hypothetical protein MHBO_004818 [Bonamia ostreae]|uniref:Uncharacterized protein n=1 Tax=Bonamia ostreae TaxID=126728 RepID=A0ABV2AV48_9EUKA